MARTTRNPSRMWSLRSLVRDQRGTASVEAAVMLPVMAICWAGLMLRYDQLERYLDAARSARRDAWSFSQAGCEDCPDKSTSELKVAAAGGDEDGGGLMNGLAEIPVVGFFVTTITGFELKSTSRRSYPRPPLLGGGTGNTAYTYFVMCNEKSRTPDEVIAAVLCQTVSSLGFGFAVGTCPMQPQTDGTACAQQQ